MVGSRPSAPLSKAELGKLLFHDPILSLDSTVSCASCHIPAFAFADTVPLSKGVGGAIGSRNTPSAMNMAARSHFFFDGRAATLAEQALGPIANPVEMNLPVDSAIARLNRHPAYRQYFRKLYRSRPTAALLGDALEAFQNTLETSSTPFDRWMKGNTDAMTPDQIAGRKVFMEKGKCFDCHFGPDFTGDEFRNAGLFDGVEWNDVGRFAVTKDSADLGKFKVPGLRNIAVTAPYMHNGRMATLREVIDFYNDPYSIVPTPINMDTIMEGPLHLSELEKQQLEAFLHALTDDRFESVVRK
jgi:cytochrome c peroxidase